MRNIPRIKFPERYKIKRFSKTYKDQRKKEGMNRIALHNIQCLQKEQQQLRRKILCWLKDKNCNKL